MLIPVIIFTLEEIDKALLAHDAAKLAEATLSGNEELARQLATDLAISVGLELAAIPGGVLGKKIIQRVTKLLTKKGLDDVASTFHRITDGGGPNRLVTNTNCVQPAGVSKPRQAGLPARACH